MKQRGDGGQGSGEAGARAKRERVTFFFLSIFIRQLSSDLNGTPSGFP